MTTLINPANNQPCEFVASQCGYIALRLTCTVTPAIQWFTQAAIEAANPVHTCEHDPRLTGMVYDQPQPAPEPLTLVVYPWMAASIDAKKSLGSRVRVQQVTVWHSTMRVAA